MGFLFVLKSGAAAHHIWNMANLNQFEAINTRWDYDKALMLCEPYIKNQVLLSLLKSRKNSFNESKLRELFHEIKDDFTRLVKSQPNTQKTNPSPVHAPKQEQVEYQNQPLEIKALISERMHYFKQYEVCIFKIRDPEISKATRATLAHEALDFIDKVQAIWQKLDYYNQHGTFPPEKMPIQITLTDKADLSRRKNTLRTYLSKIKKGKMAAEKKEAYQAELEEINRKLN